MSAAGLLLAAPNSTRRSAHSAFIAGGVGTDPVSQLKLTVKTIAVATKFPAYVGGGTNISPPDTIGGGNGIPLISFSNGASFLAGEVSSQDEKVKLIKITFTVTNPAQEPTSFKIGDVLLVIGSDRLNDFVAVGYDSKLCAMSDADRKSVKEIVVTVPPAGTPEAAAVMARI